MAGVSAETGSLASVNSLDEGGPWGLVIIISAFMIQVFTFGTACSIGVYNMELLDYFDNDVNGVSLLTSINIAFFMGGGLIANWLASKFTHRVIALVGAAGVCSGLFGMAWMNSLKTMIPFYGVLCGLGGCFAYAPSHTLSGLYYNKYRSLATGLATSGSGLGTAVFPPLISFLIDEYSWRGSLIFLAGLNLHSFIFAMLLRPPPPQPPQEELEENNSNDQSEQVLTKVKILKQKYCLFCDFGFDVYFVSNILWNCGSAIYIAFGPEFFKSVGLSKMEASFMLTLFGLGQFVGGIIGGIVGNIPQLNRLYIYVASCLVGGAMIFVFPLVDSYAIFGTLSFFFGFCFGILLGLLIIVMTDLIGTDNIGIGLGYILLADGVGAFLGPPVAGILLDEFGQYEQSLYFSGLTIILGGLLIFLIPLQRRLCENNNDEPQTEGQDNIAVEPSPPPTPKKHHPSQRKRLSDVAEERGRRSISVKSSGTSLKSMDAKRKEPVEQIQEPDGDYRMSQPVSFYGNDALDVDEITFGDSANTEVKEDNREDEEKVVNRKGDYEAVKTSSGSPEHGDVNQLLNEEQDKKSRDRGNSDGIIILTEVNGKITVRF